MKPRLERLQRLFERALELEADVRGAFLDEACGGEVELRAELDALLEADREPLTLDTPLAVRPAFHDEEDSSSWPEVIGGFRLVRMLGAGGMGTVFEAEQDNPRRSVALKVIRIGLAGSKALRRFDLEAQALARLDHPGIARIHAAGIDTLHGARAPYFAMELVRGQSITSHCRSRACSRQEKLELLARICDAVQHAHERGVVHRDLKPGNVLVDELGAPRVLDFGIARLSDDESGATRMTETGQILGSLHYMSPEQFEGDPAAIDGRADVYALGAIGYELLAGRRPLDFEGLSLALAARAVQEREPARLSTIDRACRGDLDTIFAKALEKDRARRYASPAALADDLRRYLRDEPVSARPATTLYQLHKLARRNPWLVRGVGATSLALLAGTALSWHFALRARDGERAALAREGEAKAALELAQAKERKSQRVARLFVDTIEWANPLRVRGDEISVRQALDAARERLAQAGGEDPDVEAALRHTLARAYLMLGRGKSARAEIERAYALRKELEGETGVETRATLGVWAEIDTRLGDHAAALGRVDRLIELELGSGAPDAENLAHWRAVRVSNLRSLGRLEDARSAAESELQRARSTPDWPEPEHAELLHNYACVLLTAGEYTQGEPVAREAVARATALYGERDARVMWALDALASHLTRLERHDEAEAIYRRALATLERTLTAAEPSVAVVRMNLALSLRAQGCLDDAVREMRAVLDTQRRELGPDSTDALLTQNNLAGVLRDAGHLAEFLELSGDACERAQRVLPRSNWLGAVLQLTHGCALARAGFHADAEAVLTDAHARLEAGLGSEHEFTRTAIEYQIENLEAARQPARAAEWRARLPAH